MRSSRTASPKDKAAPLYLSFDDNTLLAALFGEHDQHLARIEQRLGVAISGRGNRVAVNGPAAASQAAKDVLLELYDLLKRGVPVGAHEVDAALRMAQAGDGKGTVGRLTADGTTVSTQRSLIMPRSPNQAAYIRALQERELVFGIGPAGTGKTYLAVAVAAAMLAAGQVERLILSRPAVEAGERLGFLPGDLREKVDPYLRPLYDALRDMMPAEKVVSRLESEVIEIAPLAFMRGRTLTNAFVILDEAQNTTPVQMKMFLTRLGENSRMAVTGDPSQVDLPRGTRSGLKDALDVTKDIDKVAVIRFGQSDVVRHDLVTQIVRAYESHERKRSDRHDDDTPQGDGDGP